MAREMDEFEWPLHHTRRSHSKYPWDQWLNGKPWELTHEVDYQVKTGNFITVSQAAAKKQQGEVKWVRTGDKTIVIQFVKTPTEES